jgi:hypothetical protein
MEEKRSGSKEGCFLKLWGNGKGVGGRKVENRGECR